MIVEDFGCTMPILSTWLTIVLISLPPFFLEIVAGVYGCLSIHAFYNRSTPCGIRSNNNTLNSKRYLTLMFFSACDLIVGIPVTLFYLYLNIKGLVPFPGLAVEHYKFSVITPLPSAIWRSNTLDELSFELNRWITVWAAFVFFAIFGFTEESRNNYRSMLQPVIKFVVKKSGIKTGSKTSSNNSNSGCVFTFLFLYFFKCSPSDIPEICYF